MRLPNTIYPKGQHKHASFQVPTTPALVHIRGAPNQSNRTTESLHPCLSSFRPLSASPIQLANPFPAIDLSFSSSLSLSYIIYP